MRRMRSWLAAVLGLVLVAAVALAVSPSRPMTFYDDVGKSGIYTLQLNSLPPHGTNPPYYDTFTITAASTHNTLTPKILVAHSDFGDLSGAGPYGVGERVYGQICDPVGSFWDLTYTRGGTVTLSGTTYRVYTADQSPDVGNVPGTYTYETWCEWTDLNTGWQAGVAKTRSYVISY